MEICIIKLVIFNENLTVKEKICLNSMKIKMFSIIYMITYALLFTHVNVSIIVHWFKSITISIYSKFIQSNNIYHRQNYT